MKHLLIVLVTFSLGCQNVQHLDPIDSRIAWDSDARDVVLLDAVEPEQLVATAPGTLWLLYYYEDGRIFTCRQDGDWRGLIEVKVDPDTVYHPADAARYEEPCSVKWSNRLRVDSMEPNEGRVRLEYVVSTGATNL